MSRITRSQTAFEGNDENAAPKQHRFTKRGSGTGGGLLKANASGSFLPAPTAGLVAKPSTSNTRKSRIALGDISNKIQKNKEDQMPKKKRVVDGLEKEPKQTNALDDVDKDSTSNQENQNPNLDQDDPCQPSKGLDDLVEDVDMKGDSDTSLLEDSVADLKLSSIDAADANDPQCAAEYIGDIMNHLKKTEGIRTPSPTYMSRQTDINAKMREILIDWLVEVHLKFKLLPETLFLTVNLIDRFLERRAVSRTKLQLVGCTAMLIAAKYEEIYAPEVRDFVYISDKAYTRDQILTMESIMLNTLGFHITVPTSLRFGERYMKVAGLSPEGRNLSAYFMELTMQEYKFLKYLPSLVASSAVLLANKMTTTGETWNGTLEHHTGYDENALRACATDLYQLAIKSPPKYKAVRKKYLNKKYLEVSKLTPVNPFE